MRLKLSAVQLSAFEADFFFPPFPLLSKYSGAMRAMILNIAEVSTFELWWGLVLPSISGMVTFTLPSELREIFFGPHAKDAFDLFFAADREAPQKVMAGKAGNNEAAF